MKNISKQINNEGKGITVEWEIIERFDAVDPPYVWSAAARGLGEDGSEWECACEVMDSGGNDWEIINYDDVWQDFSNDDAIEKLWVTKIIAIDPRQPEIGGKPNYKEFGGPNVPGKTQKDAEDYCQNNGLGYCKVEGILIEEIPLTDEEFNGIVSGIAKQN
jgi:hypothetical protein